MKKSEWAQVALKLTALTLDVHRATVEIHQKSIDGDFERAERRLRQRRQRSMAPQRCRHGYEWGTA